MRGVQRIVLAHAVLLASALVFGLLEAPERWPYGLFLGAVVGVFAAYFLTLGDDIDRLDPFRRRPRSR